MSVPNSLHAHLRYYVKEKVYGGRQFLPAKSWVSLPCYVMKERSAGAVIFRKDKDIKYLLLQYKYKNVYWDFPKGNIEEKEKDEDTVKREIKEETGIQSIEIIPDFKEIVRYFYKRNDQTVSKEVVYFLVETDEKEVKISEEHIGYIWLDYEKALKKLTFPNSKSVLEKANEFLKKNKQKQLFDFK